LARKHVDVIVSNSKGKRVVMVEEKKLPTYESFGYAEGDTGLFSASKNGIAVKP
jgi:hypothetical protein